MNSGKLLQLEAKLISQNLASEVQINQVRQLAIDDKKGFFELLVNLKTLPTLELYQLAARIWSVSFIDIELDNLHERTTLSIPKSMLVDLDALAFINHDGAKFIVFGSPENLSQVNQLRFFSQESFNTALGDIHQIRKLHNQDKQRDDKPPQTTHENNELTRYLLSACEFNASDIHIEMFSGYCRLRVRVDGMLHLMDSISVALGKRLISQIKLLSTMDIAQSRLPQDGRFSYQLSNKSLSLRVNCIPTIHGEKVVLRLLEQHGKRFKLDQIGLFSHQYQLVREIVKHPNGLILVAGPTGSGKTVTLYAILALLNTGKENICTIEDPVEIHEDGINQISINRKAGLDFSQALRAILRQDPDILMVGEIRDAETAQIAVKAAQTGHLVLTTVHSRTAKDATSRLINLGIEAHSLNEALKLVMAQRLPRALCQVCREQQPLAPSLDAALRANQISIPQFTYQAKGCSSCMQGYFGRIGMIEILHHDENINIEMKDKDNTSHSTLQSIGLKRVINGDTSYEELIRVL